MNRLLHLLTAVVIIRDTEPLEFYSAGTFALGPSVNELHTKLIRLTGEGQRYSRTIYVRGTQKRYQCVVEKKNESAILEI